MLQKINPQKIIFLDIETVPEAKNWSDLEEDTQKLYELKTRFQRKEEFTAEEFYEDRAGIYAEFGKIVCITIGMITAKESFRLKSFCNRNEFKLLTEFAVLFEENFNHSSYLLCAHNGKEFDFPFIVRRLLINQIPIPSILNIQGKKPWEVNHLDTMELWKFGDYKHYTSVKLLAHVFGIPSPKDDIDGSEVASVYYKEKNLERIQKYCEKDVITIAQIFRKMRYEPLLFIED